MLLGFNIFGCEIHHIIIFPFADLCKRAILAMYWHGVFPKNSLKVGGCHFITQKVPISRGVSIFKPNKSLFEAF